MLKNKLDSVLINLTVVLLISIYIIFSQQGEINRDGVMYLTQAQFFLEGNVSKAMQVYGFPFFAKLIILAEFISGLSLHYAAHALNLCLFMIAVFFFYKTIEHVSQNKIPVYISTLILLTSLPLMDDYLPMILRDHGQWAGFMMGIFFYFKWLARKNIYYAILWQTGFIFGAIFRPECLIFNLLLPFINLFFTHKDRLKNFLQSILIPLLGFLTLIFFLIISDHSQQEQLESFKRYQELITRPLNFIIFFNSPLNIHTNDPYLKILIFDFMQSFKYLFLTYVVLYKWLAGLGLLHLSLFVLTLKKKLISQQHQTTLLVFFCISLIITVINLYTTFVISNRYWMMNWWIVYIFAAFALHYLLVTLHKSKHPRKEWLQYIFVGILLIYFLNIIIDKPSQHFEQQAGRWVKQQQLDLNNIFFSDRRIAFYSGLIAFDPVDFHKATNIIQYKYLMMRYSKFDDIKSINNYDPIQYFPSKELPKVIIYQRIDHD